MKNGIFFAVSLNCLGSLFRIDFCFGLCRYLFVFVIPTSCYESN